MRRLLFLALVLGLAARPAGAATTIVWFSGAEMGAAGTATSDLPNCGGTPGVTTSNVHAGGYAATLGGTQCITVIPSSGLNLTEVYTRFSFRISALPGAGVLERMHQLLACCGNGPKLTVFVNSAGNLVAKVQQDTVTAGTGATVLTANTWYVIDVHFIHANPTGGVEVKLNGSSEINNFGLNTTFASTVDQIRWNAGVTAAIVTVDDMMWCTGGYCPSGQTIARQGDSGTPTYDAWTKSGCTTIDQCWSNTPFSTGTNATNATSAQAQTMFVYPLSSVQAGHGLFVIQNGTTLNACKTSMVAKASSGGSMSIRRRLSGSDTDTAQTLTTSDAYYDDGIWTDTTANVNGGQYGVLQGNNGVTQTVEDVWLQCDGSTTAVSPVKHKSNND